LNIGDAKGKKSRNEIIVSSVAFLFDSNSLSNAILSEVEFSCTLFDGISLFNVVGLFAVALSLILRGVSWVQTSNVNVCWWHEEEWRRVRCYEMRSSFPWLFGGGTGRKGIDIEGKAISLQDLKLHFLEPCTVVPLE